MKTEKRTHKGYKEFQEAQKKGFPIRQLFGEFQYIFSSVKGKISCAELLELFGSKMYWEIYCLEGKLFEDIERFPTFEQAKEKCKEFLK